MHAWLRYFPALVLVAAFTARGISADSLRVVLIDGQNNHNWKATTPVMKKYLDAPGRFVVTVATSPPRPGKGESAEAYKEAMAKFNPDLSQCDVLVSNYNGDPWSKPLNDAVEARVKEGRMGLVIVHAANNAFGGWKEYYRMIGMGWQGPAFGDRLYYDDAGNPVRQKPGEGQGAGHRYTGPFTVTVRDPDHPVTKGMPREWIHNRDELYDNMRGPIADVRVLATAYADKAKKGTGVHEPMIWTVSYGKGRVFHTPMGHDVTAMQCVGFAATLQRGTEWAATGAVTIPLPQNFPTAEKASVYPEK